MFAWYLRRGVILTKDNLAKRNWQGSKKCVFCHHDENINTFSFSVILLGLYGQSSRLVLTYTHHGALRIFSAIGLMEWIVGLNYLLGWERLPLFGRYGYVEMTRSLTTKIRLLCRSSTGAQLRSVHGRLYSVWSTATYSRWCLRGWIRRGIFFPTWMAA